MTGDPKRLRDADVSQDGGVRNSLDQPRPKRRSRNPENHISRQVGCKLWLRNVAAGRRAAKSHDGVEVMHSTIRFEPDLANRSTGANERTHISELARWCDGDLGICSWTRTAARRLGMASRTTV